MGGVCRAVTPPRMIDLERELADAEAELACEVCPDAGECELQGYCLLELAGEESHLEEAA